MTTERLVNFPAKTNPAGSDIVYVGDQSDAGNEVKCTIDEIAAGMGAVVLLRANNLSDLASASAARTNLGLGTAAVQNIAFFLQTANNLSDLASAATARTNLGLGTAATHAATDFLLVANNLSDLASASTARTNLGLGTAAVKAASDGTKSTVASVTGSFTIGHIATFADTAGTIQDGGATSAFLLAANNLSDVASASTSRTNLGLGTAATKAASDNTKSVVAMISGSITSGHYAQFSDTSGTLQDGGTAPAGVLLSANNLSDVASVPTSRTNLGLGTAATANASSATGTVAAVTGAFTVGHLATFSDTSGTIQDGGATPAGALLAVNNLSDVANAATSRTNLGLGTAATQNSTFFAQVANNLSDLASASTARTNLGLGTAATKAASDNTKATLASVTGSFTAGHVATFADTSGTIQDGGVAIKSFSIVIQTFTSNGTYTPTAGMVNAIGEAVGGGAGGGGCENVVSGGCGGGGGGAGSYAQKNMTAASVGASQTITIGAAGTGGAAGNNNGTNGSDTSIGSLCIGKGGAQGAGGAAGNVGGGGAGGIVGTGDVTVAGQNGGAGINSLTNSQVPAAGTGGMAFFGGGNGTQVNNTGGTTAGNTPSGYGCGGNGGVSFANGGAVAGGPGKAGYVVITEFIYA